MWISNRILFLCQNLSHPHLTKAIQGMYFPFYNLSFHLFCFSLTFLNRVFYVVSLLILLLTAFKSLRVRVGGSLQDQVLYDLGNLTSPCQPFRKLKGGLFGFSKGCLHMKRWDELNNFFKRTG